jgi:hypothetical protein
MHCQAFSGNALHCQAFSGNAMHCQAFLALPHIAWRRQCVGFCTHFSFSNVKGLFVTYKKGCLLKKIFYRKVLRNGLLRIKQNID